MKLPTYRAYARSIITKHSTAFFHAVAALRKQQRMIHLHRVRVASRRLRTALWIFKDLLRKEDRAYLRAQVRTVSKTLSTARDLDTQIIFLQSISGRSSTDTQDTIRAILHKLHAQRRHAQRGITRTLSKLPRSDIRKRLRRALQDSDMADLPKSTHQITSTARKKIHACLERLDSYEPIVTHPRKIDELHQLRIAAKRLRYTLESFGPLYGKQLDPFIKEAKAIQDTLGDMHNYHVWMQDIPATAGGNQLRTLCRRGKKDAYKEFRKVWRKQEKKKLWRKLRKVTK